MSSTPTKIQQAQTKLAKNTWKKSYSQKFYLMDNTLIFDFKFNGEGPHDL